MNKLLLNERGRNHIKFYPMKDTANDIPETDAGKIEWCKNRFHELQHSADAKRLVIYKHKGKGYLISVWELNGLYYLIECIRNEFKTFNTTIYISKEKDDSINIAKFIQENIDTIMADYKKQILDARDELVKNAVVGEAHDA